MKLAVVIAVLGMAGTAHGQELEPRAYSTSPMGTHFLVVGYGHSRGSVILDPSIQVTDVTASIDAAFVGYAGTFGLARRTASLAATLPYVQGDMSGRVGEERTSISRSGLGDVRVRFAANLWGGGALTPEEFRRRAPTTTLGTSLVVVAPTGQYYPTRLINIGTNRWAFKPDIGLSHPIGKWVLDVAAGVWLYTDNSDFYGGKTRSQAAVWALQGHVSYSFRPGLWLAADATFYQGGRSSIDGVESQDRLENSRSGLVLAVPFATSYSLKLGASTGVTTRVGGKFDSYTVALQYRWFGR